MPSLKRTIIGLLSMILVLSVWHGDAGAATYRFGDGIGAHFFTVPNDGTAHEFGTGPQFFFDPSSQNLSIGRGVSGASFTRAGTVYTSTGGATVAANTLRYETVGGYASSYTEPQGVNLCKYSRDLSQAEWSKSGCTGLLNQTGRDGQVNAASSLEAYASGATCYQSVTSASATTHYFSVSIKRLVGTSGVSITLDNGNTWTDITSSLSTTSWYRASSGVSGANPTVGFRLEASGDKLAIDHAQVEATRFASSPIYTTTSAVTRTTEENYPLWNLPSGIFDDKGTVICWVRFGYAYDDQPTNTTNGIVTVQNNAAGLLYNRITADPFYRIQSSDGPNVATKTFQLAAKTWYKPALQFPSSAGKFRVGMTPLGTAFKESSWGTEANFDGSYTLGNFLRLGYGLFGPMWIRDIRVYDTVLSTTEIGNIMGLN